MPHIIAHTSGFWREIKNSNTNEGRRDRYVPATIRALTCFFHQPGAHPAQNQASKYKHSRQLLMNMPSSIATKENMENEMSVVFHFSLKLHASY
jgi:hypothetical protein